MPTVHHNPRHDARACALDLLDAVLSRRTPFDEAIERHAGLARLAERDRAFARLLVATTLRRLGQIDALIDGCLARPLPAKAARARHALRLGACQLVFLATPPHAAVDATVALVRGRDMAPYRGLVNAVLRRIAGEGRARAAAQDAARLNTPDWLWRRWNAAYGEASARAIAAAHLAEPPLDLTVRDDAATWATRLAATLLPTGSLRRTLGGAVSALPGYAEGAWWVQDAAAALPVRLLGDVAGAAVLDLGAAPGGKTAQLAAVGARVTAVDRAPRLPRLEANLARLGLAAATVAADMTDWRPDQPAPFVLLDAPCSATGTIRRHPDVARLKRAADVARLAALQDRLLDAACAMLAPGGTLVYCVCSLEPEEGEDRIAALLARRSDFARAPVAAAEVGGLAEFVTAAGDLRTLPCHLAAFGGLDGFYAARLRRRI
ncbi:MAG: RsmB/NOP family class I SAM-dependent RNA methyltransferase [Alphaproteobacteria bacterium]